MESLKNNPYIIEVEQIINDETVSVFRMKYHSGNRGVFGYIAEPKSGSDLPCLIVNRGGSKDLGIWTDESAARSLSRFASLGYVAVASQYSGGGGSDGKDEWGGQDIEDILVFKELLMNHPRADMGRIGMFGVSRGGMMVYRALAEVNWIKAAVSRAGVSNVYRSHKLRPEATQWHADMFDVTDDSELQKRSAVFWPEKFCKTTPLLLLHGSADDKVSVLDSIELAQKLHENNVPCELKIFEGDDHRISTHKNDEVQMIEQWFERYLKNNDTLPSFWS